MTELGGWANFYVIVGSSAGALIGLQFVVLTLIANRPLGQTAPEAGAAFATPTIVHLGTVLLLSAAITAPWRSVSSAVWFLVALGGVGTLYALIVTRRLRLQTAYRPEFEDWLFHCLLPLASYITLFVSAYEMLSHEHEALFGVAAAALLLLFAAIHNAWDGVTYHVLVSRPDKREPSGDGQRE
jgi:hypothetical protein